MSRLPIRSDPRIMHGTPCFEGTRVTVITLFDWIEEGHDIDYFLEQFPSVKRDAVVAILEIAGQRVVTEALASH